jgi:hypothetical protein
METHEKSYKVKVSGFVAILIQIVLVAVAVLSFITGPEVESHVNVGVIALVIACIIFPGYGVNEPNVSHVMTFFGKYTGTVFSNGFYWVNPFFIQKKVMLRIHNLDVEPIKVNDKVGNPVMIGAVLVWRVKDTYKAIFDINKNIEEFVKVQSDAALRQVAGMYAYDSNSSKTDDDSVTLRSDNNGEVAQRLENELSSRLSLAGIEVVEARINYLAYAQEIACVVNRLKPSSQHAKGSLKVQSAWFIWLWRNFRRTMLLSWMRNAKRRWSAICWLSCAPMNRLVLLSTREHCINKDCLRRINPFLR